MRFPIALIVAFLLLAGSAQAQLSPLNPFKGTRGQYLAASDLTLMEQAGQKFLGETAPAKGSTETWQNPATGAAGKVAYLGPTTHKTATATYPCRRVRYDVTQKNQKPRSTRVAWCHLPDGSWKLN